MLLKHVGFMYAREFFQLKFRISREQTCIYSGDYHYNIKVLEVGSAFSINFNLSFIIILGMLN